MEIKKTIEIYHLVMDCINEDKNDLRQTKDMIERKETWVRVADIKNRLVKAMDTDEDDIGALDLDVAIQCIIDELE